MTEIKQFQCPSDEIGAYIDGEMGEERFTEFERHLASCTECKHELTRQKQFLCGLNASLSRETDIELPANFARLVVTNAESRVSGLRRPRELYDAVFIIAALLLFGLFAAGENAESLFGGVAVFFDQIAAVGAVIGRFIYSIYIGIAVVLRTLGSQVGGESGVLIMLPATSILVILIAFGRLSRLRRA